MVTAKASVKISACDYVSHAVALPNVLTVALTNCSIVSLPLSLDSGPHTVQNSLNDVQISGLDALPSIPSAITSCDSNGRLKVWDLRAPGTQKQLDTIDPNLTVTAMGTSNFGEIAIGTEANPDAEVVLFDVRKLNSREPLVKYVDSHNDDVTDLQFHPTVHNRLVSGSTDGVVNLFDISIANEDDAVVQAFNHQASIHKAGFFTDSHEAVKTLRIGSDLRSRDKVFALSHMETLTVYPVSFEDEFAAEVVDSIDDPPDTKPVEFGDLREAWRCQYVVDYHKQHFMVGSNDEQWAALIPVLNGQPHSRIVLEGGHGEEVLRCFDLGQSSGACYTGGEDGCVKLWDITGQFSAAVDLITNLAKSDSKSVRGKSSSKKKLSWADPLKGHKKKHKKD